MQGTLTSGGGMTVASSGGQADFSTGASITAGADVSVTASSGITLWSARVSNGSLNVQTTTGTISTLVGNSTQTDSNIQVTDGNINFYTGAGGSISLGASTELSVATVNAPVAGVIRLEAGQIADINAALGQAPSSGFTFDNENGGIEFYGANSPLVSGNGANINAIINHGGAMVFNGAAGSIVANGGVT